MSQKNTSAGTSGRRAEQFYGSKGKSAFVREIFDGIASRYDQLNTVTSFGLHRRWRAAAVSFTRLHEGGSALDIACGTGDFLPLLRRAVGTQGRVVGLDFSRNMLRLAARRAGKDAFLVQGDAEMLPFGSKSLDAITVGFALRNFTNVELCFREMHRVLVPGGRLVALEIARPQWWPYRPLFLLYFEKILPLLARLFGGEATAYRWLPASLAAFPPRAEVLEMLDRAGFSELQVRDLAAGAVCIFVGVKQ